MDEHNSSNQTNPKHIPTPSVYFLSFQEGDTVRHTSNDGPPLSGNLLSYPLQEWRTLAPLSLSTVRVRHSQVCTIFDLPDLPGAILHGIVKESLVLLKASTTALGQIRPRPKTGNGIRSGEDEEEPVAQVVEHDGRQEGDGEVGEAPDDNADGGGLSASGGRIDLCGNQL